jgi:Tfp pilus assembly protein PilO
MIRRYQADFRYLAWNMQQIFRGIGWPGFVGILFLIAAACIVGVGARPWAIEIKDIRENAKNLRGRMTQKQAMEVRSDPAMQLAEFYKLFPDTDSLVDTLERIYAVASKNNLSLDHSEYNLSAMSIGHLQTYEISFPVRGRYVQVRNFISELLAQNKNMALSEVSLTRNSVTDIGVEANLKLTVYVQGRL